ncbi:hypothetical protein [Capnocytophaga sp.]|uniref:hypothetical protein n=1 Tax=Capnocytophaga sp. TaxID=44737 RepID=UPI0026DAB805|nr:hypothetical protein [Capnocytophaga sp.]MDO5106600.1 hypothetical protein [Capnocytophaga sp.]
MYAYQNNILSIPARLLYEDWGLISYDYYKKLCTRGKLQNTKPGKGQGNEAWVSFHELPVVKGVDIKEFCIKMLGKPEDANIVQNDLEPLLVPDLEAINFFAGHRKPNGKPLTIDQQREKATSAMILNAVETLLKGRGKSTHYKGKKVQVWENISKAVNALNPERWRFDLPNNPRVLQRKFNQYKKEGYFAFIHRGEGSENAKIVTPVMERLFISICCLPNKPYISSVYTIYQQFLHGKKEIFDRSTGELFNVEKDFCDAFGNLIEVSESTVKSWLKKPENQLVIKKARNGDYDFSHKERPHVNRHAPMFSMSKISLDDRDILHTKMHDGSKVMAYYAYDVMSTALIGIAHSKKKNAELFLDCFRNMFQFTTSYGLGTPMQIEVERHLTGEFVEGLLKADNVFPFVRFCNPTNSQEKYAETGIRLKKYGVEKNNHQNVGRHYSKRDANRVTQQKIFDEYNDNYKEAKASYEQIVAMDLQEQIEFNNELHPDQERFAGKTRLQVFLENVNPNLPKLNKALLAQYIGFSTHTTIRRNQYVTVQYQKYQLPNPQIISLLESYEVEAFYFPSSEGIGEVYLYQNNQFLCECKQLKTFNRANAEWTETDKAIYQEQMSYIKGFDQFTKEKTAEKLSKIGIIEAQPQIEVEYNTVDYQENETPVFEYENTKKSNINKAILDL